MLRFTRNLAVAWSSPRRVDRRPGAPGAAAAGLAVVMALANVAATANEAREIDLTLDAGEPAPMLSVVRSAVTTVTFLDAEGAPWPITAWHSSEGAPHAVREASHPHVATLQATGRQHSGNVVAFLDGLTDPVHLALSRDAPAALRVTIRVGQTRRDAGRPAPDKGLPLPSRKIVEDIVRDYLLANPGVLREAADPSRQLVANVRDLRQEIVGQPGVPAEGDPSGSVTVVEFFDYGCRYCKRSMDAVRTALDQPGVRVELREYPILGPGSERAARLALAADLQGRYLEAHNALMEREGGYEGEDLPEELASAVGLDAARLRADMASAEVAGRIAANRQLAGRLGVTGTPAFLFLGPTSVEVSPGALDATRMAELIGAVR